MRIHIRPVTHTEEELELGSVVFYEPVITVDAISVTADEKGFSTLKAVTRFLKYDIQHAVKIAATVNARGKSYVLPLEDPTLIFVPKAATVSDDGEYVRDMLEACEFERCYILNFTQYNLIVGNFPSAQIITALSIMKKFQSDSGPYKIWFDMDVRYIKEFQEIYRKVIQS